tara:strand:+ start:19 stop:141 length:123 start_codon:yes stop_codon:yes gene_type:complete
MPKLGNKHYAYTPKGLKKYKDDKAKKAKAKNKPPKKKKKK